MVECIFFEPDTDTQIKLDLFRQMVIVRFLPPSPFDRIRASADKHEAGV